MQIITNQLGFWRTGINDSSITEEVEDFDERNYLDGLCIPLYRLFPVMKRIVSNVSSPFVAHVTWGNL